MILRAHHIFCIQGFRGKGYSEDFVHNMKNIIGRIEEQEDLDIEIINSADYVCISCPKNIGQENTRMFEQGYKHKKRGYCQNEDYINRLDNSVLEVLNIKANSKFTYKELLKMVKDNLTESKFKKICGNCEWYSLGYCKEGLFEKSYTY